MEVERNNVSVVILAKDHNPSILHPSFLSSQEIVPDDWETSEPAVCTPAFSIVKYKNGIIFSVEREKLQVIKALPSSEFCESELPDLVSRYVDALPHVKYTAIGINMVIVIKHPDPEKFLIDRFVKVENCNFDELPLKGVVLRFIYILEDSVKLNLSCERAIKVEQGRETQEFGIAVNANYHIDIKGENRLEEVKEVLKGFKDRCNHFEKIVLPNVLGV